MPLRRPCRVAGAGQRSPPAWGAAAFAIFTSRPPRPYGRAVATGTAAAAEAAGAACWGGRRGQGALMGPPEPPGSRSSPVGQPPAQRGPGGTRSPQPYPPVLAHAAAVAAEYGGAISRTAPGACHAARTPPDTLSYPAPCHLVPSLCSAPPPGMQQRDVGTGAERGTAVGSWPAGSETPVATPALPNLSARSRGMLWPGQGPCVCPPRVMQLCGVKRGGTKSRRC